MLLVMVDAVPAHHNRIVQSQQDIPGRWKRAPWNLNFSESIRHHRDISRRMQRRRSRDRGDRPPSPGGFRNLFLEAFHKWPGGTDPIRDYSLSDVFAFLTSKIWRSQRNHTT